MLTGDMKDPAEVAKEVLDGLVMEDIKDVKGEVLDEVVIEHMKQGMW